jgi:UDP-GlcNAc:undecaprenyl-phosphate GlcNAc-1-phosphate transferase
VAEALMKVLALTYCVTFLLALATSLVATRYVRNLALARRWRTKPPRNRDVHTSPIPRLGGVAIFVSFLLVVGLVLAFSPMVRARLGLSFLLSILGPATVVFLLGLYDDVYHLGALTKFAAQAAVAVLVFLAGFRVFNLPLLFGQHDFGWVASLVATVFWVLLITNAFNLVDGLDGLAAGSALFSIITLVVVALVHSRLPIALLGLALAGATLGFLRYNFNPATIFLGDSGSLTVGFLLSVLALVSAQKSPTMVAVAIPIVSFGLPILETALSVVRRFLSGRPLFNADRQHIHHKLLEQGLSHRQVVVVLYGLSALFGLLSMFLLYPGGPSIAIVLFVVGVVIWLGVQHLNYPEFFELRRVAHRTLEQKRIIVNNLAFRRATYRLPKVATFSELWSVLEDAFRENDFDAFDLRLNAESEYLYDLHGGGLVYAWKKANEKHQEAALEWTLTLRLRSDGTELGCLQVHRAYSKRSLQVDVNLLTDEFRAGLGDALGRVMLHGYAAGFFGHLEAVTAAPVGSAD